MFFLTSYFSLKSLINILRVYDCFEQYFWILHRVDGNSMLNILFELINFSRTQHASTGSLDHFRVLSPIGRYLNTILATTMSI